MISRHRLLSLERAAVWFDSTLISANASANSGNLTAILSKAVLYSSLGKAPRLNHACALLNGPALSIPTQPCIACGGFTAFSWCWPLNGHSITPRCLVEDSCGVLLGKLSGGQSLTDKGW